MRREFRFPVPKSLYELRPERPKNPDLVFHAKLYVFATRFLATELRILALRNLYRDLTNCFLTEKTASVVMSLVLYVYNNTTAMDEPGGKSFLREMVMTFVSRKARNPSIKDQLMKCAAGNRELVRDLLGRILKVHEAPDI